MSSAFRRLLTGLTRIALVLSGAVVAMVLFMGPTLAAGVGSNWWLLCYAPTAAVLAWFVGSKDFDWDH